MRRKTIVKAAAVIVALLTIVCSLPLFAGAGDPADAAEQTANIPRGVGRGPENVILTSGKDESSLNVTWVSFADTEAELRWAESSVVGEDGYPESYSSAAAQKDTFNSREFTYRARMTGLEPGKEYVYYIQSAETGRSEAYTVSLGETGDGAFSFIFVGDPQIGAGGTEQSTEKWNESLKKVRSWFGDRIEFMISAGDQANDFTKSEEYDGFASPEWLRSLPVLGSVGNHDDGIPYSQRFTYDDVDSGSKSDAGAYGGDYWVAHDGVLLMSLNTNNLSTASHKAFMQKAIEDYTREYGEPNWKLVYYHHSMYSAAAGRCFEDYMREHFVPIFSELGIDAALNGHDHIFTRSYMINSLSVIDDASRYTEVAGDPYGSIFDPEPGEAVYITANSSSGSKFYEMYNGVLPFSAKKNQENVPNVTKVDVTADSLTFRTYRTTDLNEIGDVVDFFAIHHTKDVEEDVYAPWLDVPVESKYFYDSAFDLSEGIFAYDNFDGDVTSGVEISGELNPYAETVVTYRVTDKAGNTAVAERKMIPIRGNECVENETEWSYLDGAAYPYEENGDRLAWTRTDYIEDDSWKKGKGSFGARGAEKGVHNGFVPDVLLDQFYPEGTDEEGEIIPNCFFRTTFDLDRPEDVNYICGKLRYDDGVDIFINGAKIKSFNSALAVNYFGFCWQQCDGDALLGTIEITDPALIASLNLKSEGNVLAIELYQGYPESDDIFLYIEQLFVGIKGTKNPFSDTVEGSWYYNSVCRANFEGLFAGVSGDKFAPGMNMTRAMMWTVLARAAKAELAPGGETWYSEARKWAMTNGVSDGTSPQMNISREQIAVMLYALRGRPETAGTLDGFSDAGLVSAWAKDAVIWAVSNGLIAGRGGALLAPGDYATRAEVCTILMKYLSILK